MGILRTEKPENIPITIVTVVGISLIFLFDVYYRVSGSLLFTTAPDLSGGVGACVI